MARIRISDLTAGPLPILNTSLLEMSVPNAAAPSGYDSRRYLVSDVLGSSGTITVIAPTTGQNFAVAAGKTVVNPAAALAALTLTLPASGTVRISTRQRIDTLTITASGAAVDWPPGELPQYGVIDLTYVSSLTAWCRA